MITADTITDEQIRELLREGLDDLRKENGGALVVQIGLAEIALGIRRHRRGKDQKRRARARCAEILNARAKDSK